MKNPTDEIRKAMRVAAANLPGAEVDGDVLTWQGARGFIEYPDTAEARFSVTGPRGDGRAMAWSKDNKDFTPNAPAIEAAMTMAARLP